ncbi:hypothetical protein P7C70_g3965, partial [Phenoliferia sp. Uapishka_3]
MSSILRRSLLSSAPPSASGSTSRLFSTSPSLHATQTDLSFPTKQNPNPWEIFHLDPKSTPTRSELKARFYDLARRYHPDRQPPSEPTSPTSKGKTRDTSAEFKQIVSAYEILQSPSKRATYLRARPGANGGVDPSSAYDFRRGRPMAYGRRPAASSDYWDWATDPHNPHFRPSSYGMGKTASGWKAEGSFSSNGTVFLALIGLVCFATPLSIWTAVPSDLAQSSLATATMTDDELKVVRSGAMSGMRKHEEAAKSLERARREARVGGAEKIKALRRNAREIENRRAYDRALEVERTERLGGTGHVLALPAPEPTPPLRAGRGQ